MENASDRGVGVDVVVLERNFQDQQGSMKGRGNHDAQSYSDATVTTTELENEIERQLVELRRSYQVSIASLGLPVVQLTFPHIEESRPVNNVDDAPDVDDELAAPDDWIPSGEQHEI